MRTTKPISTIAYNTEAYLQLTLNSLMKAKIISFWAYIKHKPEDDEAGNKTHFHVYAEPAKMLQTVDLREKFMEYDPLKPDKPLGCLNFRSSKTFGDWYLYGLHDRAYLASKGETRRYHYSASEMVSSDSDDLNYLVQTIDLLSLSRYSEMLDAQAQGVTWAEYFSRGTIPIPQVRNYEYAWNALLSSHTDRNGRPGHEVEFDEVTGEVFNTQTDVK